MNHTTTELTPNAATIGHAPVVDEVTNPFRQEFGRLVHLREQVRNDLPLPQAEFAIFPRPLPLRRWRST